MQSNRWFDRGLIIFFLIFIIYLIFGFGVTISNDSATNIEQIKSLDIFNRASHFTFHLLGAGFYLLFTKLLGLHAIFSVEIMLSTISVLGVYALYRIILKLFIDSRIALITAIVYAFSTGVFRFSVQAEYLILVPSLTLMSIALYANSKRFLSGVFLALGLLTSPFAILIAPAFLLFNKSGTYFSKSNLYFALGFILLYGFIGIFTFQEAVSGEWSYSLVFRHYKKVLFEISYLRIFSIWLYGYLRSFLFLIPFLFYGVYILYNLNRKQFYIILLLILVHLPVAIPEARYGGYQLTLYPFIALIAAIGLNKTYQKFPSFCIVIMSLFILFNSYIVFEERKFNRDLRDTYVQLEHDPAIADSSLLFVYQATKPISTIYAPKMKPISMLTTYQENMAEHLPGYSKPIYMQLIEDHDNIYLIESGMSMPDDKVKLLFAGFVKSQGAKVKGFGMEKLKPFVAENAFERMKDYPLEVYLIHK